MPLPKGIPIAPLTGILDVRSIPDLLPQGALRWRQNFQTTGEGKLQRGVGWTKALSKSEYNNQDFHDQLLLFGGTVREPVTGLFEFQTSRGIRSLWLTTQSRIAKLNETTGNWKIIASGLGGGAGTDCSGPRFKAANVGDYVIFTNGYDRPKIHRLEQPPFDDVLIADIPDLETIGLTKAALVFAWRDTMILADVEMDGERLGNTFVWGDFKNPPSFDPAKPESIAGNSSFNYGERILAGGETTAGTFLMYTTHGIWELTRVADDRVFAKREAYPGRKADFVGCIKYQNTLVDIGGDHLYMAKDGIYAFNPYRSAPELVLWLHRSTSVLFDDIDETACAASIGWFHDGEAFWSAKRNSDSGCPGITLRVETQFHVADVVDHGFTAAVNYRPQPIQTIRDFILDKRICTLPCLTAELVEQDLPPPFENEGLPSPIAEPTAAFAPQSFYTSDTQTIDGVVTENWNRFEASPDSLCALLGDLTLDDLCQGCESVSVLIAASAQDWCLKQFGGFYRERCVNFTSVGTSATCDATCEEEGESGGEEEEEDVCGPLPAVSLLAYYKCDEVAYPVIDYAAGKNMIDAGFGSPFPDVEPGIINTGFFGASGAVLLRFGMRNIDPQWELTGEDAFTMRAWFWYSGSSSLQYDTRVGEPAGRYALIMLGPPLGNYFKFQIRGSISYTHRHHFAIGGVGWHRVIGIFRKNCGTFMKVDNNPTTFYPDPIGLYPGAAAFQATAPNSISISAYPKTGIDEVGVWRGAWSEAQMLYDWNSGAGRSYPDVPL